ncbi:MAG TPA: hypothetical protein VD996_08900 [Chitinophagaceae bacterium]|nr:hypothetical protein [Chitinophagaceae bacterium]
MATTILKSLCLVILLAACTSTRNNRQQITGISDNSEDTLQPLITAGESPRSLMELPQSPDGGFVLSPGFYEAEFKTYCLQPGTPDPRPHDAYLQGPVTGYRSDIVQSVLLNSRKHPSMDQRHVQLLLWSVVSGSSFSKLSPAVQADAMRLLTPKQVFELKGGVIGVIKTVSSSTGILNGSSEMQRLFEMGTSSYEAFERMAVTREPSQIRKAGVKADKWYKQRDNYYVRFFPASYKKVKIQVYVPQDIDTSTYIVFDPTGQQAIPAFTNAQRLGVGAPVIDMVRVIIDVSTKQRKPEDKKETGEVKRPSRRDSSW